MTGLWISAALLAQPVETGASVDVRLSPGEGVTLIAEGDTRGDHGPSSLHVASSHAAVLRPFDLAVIAGEAANPCIAAPCAARRFDGGEDGLPPAPPVPPGALKLSFARHPATGYTTLILENGYLGALAYRARVKERGTWRDADVCWVPPGNRGFEQFPDPVEAIELTALEFRRWHDAYRLPCGDAAR